MLEQRGRLHFRGPLAAELFSREIDESWEGVLRKNYFGPLEGPLAGCVAASVDGRPWSDTMWSRDAGVFLRELVQWGYMEHACLTAEALMRFVTPNEKGYRCFPERFILGEPGSGTELDGTGATVIGLVLLWERLPEGHLTRDRIYQFLHEDSSPLHAIHAGLQETPLVAGSGEFGGGCGIDGLYMNTVQNGLCRLALLAGSRMECQAGDAVLAARHHDDARGLEQAMKRYCVGKDGCWLWCVDKDSLLPDPAIIEHPINKGFGGINGVGCMQADLFGFNAGSGQYLGIDECRNTFHKLANTPLRKEQFEKYGIWTQFDEPPLNYMMSPSYGHGYALMMMLLLGEMDMAEKALSYLAEATWRPPKRYKLDRESPYWFYERYHSPDLQDEAGWDQGCGALNLVCVSEPLKVARVMAGIDDSNPEETLIIPRLWQSWDGFEALNWPINTRQGLRRVDVRYTRRGRWHDFEIAVLNGHSLPRVLLWPEPEQVDNPRVFERITHLRESIGTE